MKKIERTELAKSTVGGGAAKGGYQQQSVNQSQTTSIFIWNQGGSGNRPYP